MSYNGKDQWSSGRAQESSTWSNTSNQYPTGQQDDRVNNLTNGLNATSLRLQQVYNQNVAYPTQTYQIPGLQTPQQQPYANIPLLYQPQFSPNQQYQATPFPSSAYLAPAYSNPALHEQYIEHAPSAHAHTTGNYTHRSQGSYSGDQTYLHAGLAYQNRTSPAIDKGRSADSGTKSRNRGSSDRGRDKGSGRSKTHGRAHSHRFEQSQADAEKDDPFYVQVTPLDEIAEIDSHESEVSGEKPEAVDQDTFLSGASVQNNNELGVGNDVSTDTTYSSATTYGNGISQQTMVQVNISSRGAVGISTGASYHNGLTNRAIYGPLDPRFKVHPSFKFCPGAVFKIEWAEPTGANLTEPSDETDLIQHTSPQSSFHQTIRRFIVVGTDEGSSTCVPILTYHKRACTKAGLKPRQHGVAYRAGSQPYLLEGEPVLGFDPIQIEMLDAPQETMAVESRVNYSKLMTIEHNYKVFFIGRVTPQDFHDIVIPAVDACWNAKNRGLATSDHHRHLSRGSIER
ncbi:hypothetical protein B0T20DRAFT_391942 [Sordaria brevicollis]|uniref:DUF6590 domain-containing protein n=1 Tax=Sordaria brevicollis TaxID=83679 RepID=A0AAE0UCB0_SORBR|nr:hypothetical protein B0T20DRAFT_391942 [Sordaria brevicollis]